MTGKELIIYILANNLENEPVFNNGEIIGFVTITKAAEILDVGKETIRAWIKLGTIKNVIEFGDELLIPTNSLEGIKRCVK